uniref:transferrin receptor protein 2-like n=1 Tax=Monopterus albus TaxID=43700 RepID=UPI0009B4B5D3|nr:transferrin receptor protein 2-like [Monopterus albus]
MTFVTSDAEEEVGPSNDITALLLRYRHAFLLAYAVFSGHCSQVGGQGEEDEQPGGVAKPPAEGGAGLYLGELRVMMRMLLQDEDIHNMVSRVSRANHPPGSAEGTSLASEILRRFTQLQMDHTWTESLCATLQFPDRSQRSSLWLVDSAGLVAEQIPLNPSDFCPYSAAGSTTAFPSFNHTQFPPIQSSGLPLIPALPISATVAAKLLSQLSGPSCPPLWRGRLLYVRCVVSPEFSSGRRVKMSVHNVMTPVLFNNIFSSLEGRVEPDQYIILGAQRDLLSPGAVKSGVGTAILLELARTFSAMVKNGFSLRRSLLFVSWDAGEFGNVGATEWLEGYLSMLHLKAVAYFSLDQAVMGNTELSSNQETSLICQPIRV